MDLHTLILRRIENTSIGLKLACVCAVLAACGAPVAPATDASHPDQTTLSSAEPDAEYSGSCSTDYDCGRGSRCIKRQYKMSGVCGPRGGALDAGLPDGMPYSFSEPECLLDIECKRGFKCLERQCVKERLHELPK